MSSEDVIEGMTDVKPEVVWSIVSNDTIGEICVQLLPSKGKQVGVGYPNPVVTLFLLHLWQDQLLPFRNQLRLQISVICLSCSCLRRQKIASDPQRPPPIQKRVYKQWKRGFSRGGIFELICKA